MADDAVTLDRSLTRHQSDHQQEVSLPVDRALTINSDDNEAHANRQVSSNFLAGVADGATGTNVVVTSLPV